MKEHRFTKHERLSGNAEIERLFQSGNAFSIPPLRIIYSVLEDFDPVPVRVLITVSKKKFRKAVDRNRIRRKIREAYRLKKSALYNGLRHSGSCMMLGIVYTGDDADPDYHLLEDRLIQCLARLRKILGH